MVLLPNTEGFNIEDRNINDKSHLLRFWNIGTLLCFACFNKIDIFLYVVTLLYIIVAQT